MLDMLERLSAHFTDGPPSRRIGFWVVLIASVAAWFLIIRAFRLFVGT